MIVQYGYHNQIDKNLRKGKCSDCGNLYLMNIKPIHQNYTTEYDGFGKRYWGSWKGYEPQVFIPLRSYCCRARLVPTRIAIGTEIYAVIE